MLKIKEDKKGALVGTVNCVGVSREVSGPNSGVWTKRLRLRRKKEEGMDKARRSWRSGEAKAEEKKDKRRKIEEYIISIDL